MSSPELSILIPCYNEEATIFNNGLTVLEYLKKFSRCKTFEIILVNDGSTDNTLSELNRLKVSHPEFQIFSYSQNQGRGYAIKTGILASKGQYVVILDADLTYDVQHISEIMAEFYQDPKLQVVIVSPYMKGGVVKGVPPKRLFISRMANILLGGYFEQRFSTVTCVVRGYEGNLLRSQFFAESGKELHLEILKKLSIMGAKFKEIPGRLVWSTEKGSERRKTNLNFVRSAKRHFLYAMVNRPTRYLSWLSFFLIALGLYEVIIILTHLVDNYASLPASIDTPRLWTATAAAFNQSPHSAVIAITALILGFQTITLYVIFSVMKLQQEETIRHLLEILTRQQQNSNKIS